MKLTMLYFERGTTLYRGYGEAFLALVWVPNGHQWKEVELGLSIDDQERIERLSEKEAERCYPGCTTARQPRGLPFEQEFAFADLVKYRPDLFDDYDCRSIRRSPQEELAATDLVNELASCKS